MHLLVVQITIHLIHKETRVVEIPLKLPASEQRREFGLRELYSSQNSSFQSLSQHLADRNA